MSANTRNAVALVGRLAAPVSERELPSGDQLVSFRVVVPRPESARSQDRPRASSIDTIDCVVKTAALRRSALAWKPGDVLELEGALRRRFWRAAGGPASRYEVEVTRAHRISKAA